MCVGGGGGGGLYKTTNVDVKLRRLHCLIRGRRGDVRGVGGGGGRGGRREKLGAKGQAHRTYITFIGETLSHFGKRTPLK